MGSTQIFLVNLIKKRLVGKKITAAVQSPNGEHVGFILDDQTVVWVDCDEEGNGVGWLALG